jgi:hypothetical protein
VMMFRKFALDADASRIIASAAKNDEIVPESGWAH